MTENPESERRRSARVQLADTHGNLIVSLDGKVLDISVAGMAIETHSRLAPHHRISLRLRKGPELLQLQGRVVWCFLQGTRANDHGETVPVYRAGIEFTDVLSDLARDLLGFLETHEMGLEVSLVRPRRAIHALKHFVAMIAAPVSAGQLHQLERLR